MKRILLIVAVLIGSVLATVSPAEAVWRPGLRGYANYGPRYGAYNRPYYGGYYGARAYSYYPGYYGPGVGVGVY